LILLPISVSRFLNSQIVLTDSELFEQSKRVEPPESAGSNSPAKSPKLEAANSSNSPSGSKKGGKKKDDTKKASDAKKDESKDKSKDSKDKTKDSKKPKAGKAAPVEYNFDKLLLDQELYNQFNQYLITMYVAFIPPPPYLCWMTAETDVAGVCPCEVTPKKFSCSTRE
jgi:hypothetical protein